MIEFNKLFTVSVDATDIEDRGQQRIKMLLTNVPLPPLPEEWSWSRLVQEGVFRGKLPRRVATYYKKQHNKKVPPSVLERIGNRVDQYSFGEKTYTLDFTKRLNWYAGDFGDYGSCFWGARALAREALMENDVFAVRFFRSEVPNRGYARAFVLEVEDGLVIFNAYGLECRVIAYILATLFDYPYRKGIEIYIRGDTDGLIWLNDDAHQIGLELPESSITVDFEVPYAMCRYCDEYFPVDEGTYDSFDKFFCNNCC